MHGHGRAALQILALGVVAATAAFWYLVGRGQANSDTKPPKGSYQPAAVVRYFRY